MSNRLRNNAKERTDAGELQDEHPKLRQNLCDEIGYFMKEIRAEIDWLDERCENEVIGCKSEQDLFRVGRLRNFLHKIREDLRTESYLLSKSDIIVSILNEDPDDLM